MSNGLIGPRQPTGRVISLEEQLGAVTKALTAEVLRHAETRVKLEEAEREALAWRHFSERLEEEACR